jgi:hypothetical protein
MPVWQQAAGGHPQPVQSGAHWPAHQPPQYMQHSAQGVPQQVPGWPAQHHPGFVQQPAGMPSGLVMPSNPRPTLAPLPDDADPDATHVSGTSLAVPPLPPAGGDADSTVAGATMPPGGPRR